ncbi:ABC transporter permease [Alteromonadaceae bacterium M269]|nr:ABC transporter permease [Alteromonadaceae bacterium M269]
MLNYTIRRLNLLFFTLLVLSVVSFSLAFLFPGDSLTNLSGVKSPTPIQLASLQESYKVDSNYFWQYIAYLRLLLDGDWGISFTSQQPLLDDLSTTLPATVELSTYAFTLAILIGVPCGIIAGLKHHKIFDFSILSASLLGYSVPVFWLALILIQLFSLQLSLLPLSGRISLYFDVPIQSGFIIYDIFQAENIDKTAALRDVFFHLILPTLSIAIMTGTIIIRIVRRSVLNVLEQDYIKAAYGRGQTNAQVFWKHGLRNSLLPVLPLIVTQFTTLLTNAMIVEVIFSWPGIGNWLIQAIYQRDYPAIRGGMLMVSSLVIMFTISLDILIRVIDPTKGRKIRVAV